MKSRGIRKQYALAIEIGVHESAITRWKLDGALSLRNAISLCDALDVSMDWLLLGKGTPASHKTDRVMDTPDIKELSIAMEMFAKFSTKHSRELLTDFLQAITSELKAVNSNPGL